LKTNSTQIKELFKELDIKSTSPRLAIYQSLMKFKEHPSAEEIYLSIHKKHPSISVATVYKTLDLLVQTKLANKVVTAEDKVRYDARTDQHIHLYCEKTKKIKDYEDPELELMVQKYLAKKGIPNFKINQIQINIKGEIKTI
jgi:Fur family peroxide stress response transcriptional regulator